MEKRSFLSGGGVMICLFSVLVVLLNVGVEPAMGARPRQVTPHPPKSNVQVSYNDSAAPSCDCMCGEVHREQRIVGGQDAEDSEFPWLAMLTYHTKFYCGAALITRKHLLTAAHCVTFMRKDHITVTLGAHNRQELKSDSDVQTRKLKTVFAHENFNVTNFNNDIAIVELDRPVNITGKAIRTACLTRSNGGNYTGKKGVVAGWGRLAEKNKTSDTLRKVTVPIMSMEDCRNSGYNSKKITHNMFCAGYSDGKKDACQGDSGGPLHSVDAANVLEIIGIVSWGRGCARPNFPGVYTRVANYLNWIENKLKGECICKRRPQQRQSHGMKHVIRGK